MPDYRLTLFTDPLCCWCWAFQKELEQLRTRGRSSISLQYRMAALIPDWNNYRDEANAINRAAQMGPVWLHASQLLDLPLRYHVWIKDPPASSYPACIAVKCAERQSIRLGKILLQDLQHALMLEGRNIAKKEVILETARRCAADEPGFGFEQFESDFLSGKGVDAFRADLDQVARLRLHRFPALLIETPGTKSSLLTGYRTAEDVERVMREMVLIKEGVEGVVSCK